MRASKNMFLIGLLVQGAVSSCMAPVNNTIEDTSIRVCIHSDDPEVCGDGDIPLPHATLTVSYECESASLSFPVETDSQGIARIDRDISLPCLPANIVIYPDPEQKYELSPICPNDTDRDMRRITPTTSSESLAIEFTICEQQVRMHSRGKEG